MIYHRPLHSIAYDQRWSYKHFMSTVNLTFLRMKFTLTLLNFYMTFIFSGYRLSLTPVVEILLPEKIKIFLIFRN